MEYTLTVFSSIAQAAVPVFRMLGDVAAHAFTVAVSPVTRLIPPHAIPALGAANPGATLIIVGIVAVLLIGVGIATLRPS